MGVGADDADDLGGVVPVDLEALKQPPPPKRSLWTLCGAPLWRRMSRPQRRLVIGGARLAQKSFYYAHSGFQTLSSLGWVVGTTLAVVVVPLYRLIAYDAMVVEELRRAQQHFPGAMPTAAGSLTA